MRKILLLVLISFTTILSVSATQHTVFVGFSNTNSFSPASIDTVWVGDSIKFQWISGSHTTTSISVPTGAANWNQNMNSSNTVYYYPVTVTGAYTYICNFHTGMGGIFNVYNHTTTSVPFIAPKNSFAVISNPVVGREMSIKIALAQSGTVDISVYDVLGKKIETLMNENLSLGETTRTFDLEKEYNSGFYFVMMKQGDAVITRKIMIQ